MAKEVINKLEDMAIETEMQTEKEMNKTTRASKNWETILNLYCRHNWNTGREKKRELSRRHFEEIMLIILQN